MKKPNQKPALQARTSPKLAPSLCVLMVFFLGISISYAQNLRFDELAPDGEDLSVYGDDITEFQWVRGRYTNHGAGQGGFGRRRGGGWWDTDFPDSDENFLRGVQRYTNVDTNPKNYTYVELTDPQLFENIFLYMNWKRVPIGYPMSGPNFSAPEVEALREFMLRGGFVLVDDFWGQPHLDDMFVEIRKIFPEREITRLESDHEVFHIFFDIDEVAQVPGRMVTWDYGGFLNKDDPQYPPAVYAVLDDDGRVMLAANYNTDLGDGWEHTFYAGYPTQSTNDAYKIGINYLIYAFSH
ncbi:DUF4159 domain-containing protein [Gammaproteobacteria bacterium]|jgi:hypothetical protein|nr:DUF4159 domain-containing protein [Gammaproteobacteria bacterium]MDA9367546.1 DUF4159 domain-containing protein [bacterium]MDB2374942.1 DUF4159 domain-containing protein [Gammaproteobacteria bacterium]|tara:strand:- start:1266 stop:2153 length:888 start_codon:yes stop_codon:yes gene_type:complete